MTSLHNLYHRKLHHRGEASSHMLEPVEGSQTQTIVLGDEEPRFTPPNKDTRAFQLTKGDCSPTSRLLRPTRVPVPTMLTAFKFFLLKRGFEYTPPVEPRVMGCQAKACLNPLDIRKPCFSLPNLFSSRQRATLSLNSPHSSVVASKI